MKKRTTSIFSDKLYMSVVEKETFDKFVDLGIITVFKTSICQRNGCTNYVPKGKKRFCSIECYKEEMVKDEEKDEEDSW